MSNTPIVSVNIMGGLGNQLFQVAAAYAYARQTGGTLQITHIRENGNRPVYWDSILHKIHPYLVESTPYSLSRWYEPCPTQYREIGPLPSDGIYLNGYLQSSKYYGAYKDEIKSLFSTTPSSDIQERFQHIIANKERVIVVHARRTDYITYRDVHGPLEGSYYKEAIRRMKSRVQQPPIYILCGDDNRFWEEIRNDIPEVFENEHIILNELSDIDTFGLLQQFKHYIMSNSTFIWWCVWLSPHTQHVFVPSIWFGPQGPQYYEDIYESSWERI